MRNTSALVQRALHARRPPAPSRRRPCGPSGTAGCPSAGPVRPQVVRRHAGHHRGLESSSRCTGPAAPSSRRCGGRRRSAGRPSATRPLVGIGLQRRALAVEVPTARRTRSRSRGVLRARAASACGVAARSGRARSTRAGRHARLQRHEQHVVVQPVGLAWHQAAWALAFGRRGARPGKPAAAGATAASRQGTRAEVDPLGVEAAFGQLWAGPASRLDQRLQCHHQRAAGEGRHTLVRRVARADGRGGQPLPEATGRQDCSQSTKW
jgi:hypothetical protein